MSLFTISCHFICASGFRANFLLKSSSDLADVSWNKFLKMLFIRHKSIFKEKKKSYFMPYK